MEQTASIAKTQSTLSAPFGLALLTADAKGLVIESVAWDAAQVTPQYTGELLLGTTGGKIYQAAIEASDKGLVDRFVGGKEQKDVKQLYDLGDRHAITGLIDRWLSCVCV